MRRRRGFGWLLVAAALVGLTAWLLRDPPSAPPPPAPTFPRAMRPHETRRLEARRVVVKPATPAQPVARPAPAAPEVRRDPVLAALPPSRSAMVIEANALRHSRLGELLIGCLEGRRTALDEVRERLGVDLLEDLDRVAFAGDVTLLSGRFGKARWEEVFSGLESTGYGSDAVIWGGEGHEAFGVWRGEMVLVGRDAATVEAAVDRLEGRAPLGAQALDDGEAYGEVYGVFRGEDLTRLAGGEGSELARQLAEAAERVSIHVDAMNDVSLVAQVDGADDEGLDALARSLSGALSAARVKAGMEGEQVLAQLLDYAQVSPTEGAFELDLALPASFLEDQLADCSWVPWEPDPESLREPDPESLRE